MWRRRMLYLVCLIGSLVFYGFYQLWLSGLLLVLCIALPLFSLLLSLPAMLTVKANLRCPESGRIGMPLRTALDITCRYPHPPVDCKIRLVNTLTQTSYRGKPGEKIPTDHCGLFEISFPCFYAYDYLGLFRRKLNHSSQCRVYVLPKAIPGGVLPADTSSVSKLWRPKPGGGFSENYELRLYRPGDNLRHIHWKMAAKTGKLIYREAMEPAQKGCVLSVTLSGDEAALDKKLGNLLYHSQALLSKAQPHYILCATGKGVKSYEVTDINSCEQAFRQMLQGPVTPYDQPPKAENVLWQHHVGGDSL